MTTSDALWQASLSWRIDTSGEYRSSGPKFPFFKFGVRTSPTIKHRTDHLEPLPQQRAACSRVLTEETGAFCFFKNSKRRFASLGTQGGALPIIADQLPGARAKIERRATREVHFLSLSSVPRPERQ